MTITKKQLSAILGHFDIGNESPYVKEKCKEVHFVFKGNFCHIFALNGFSILEIVLPFISEIDLFNGDEIFSIDSQIFREIYKNLRGKSSFCTDLTFIKHTKKEEYYFSWMAKENEQYTCKAKTIELKHNPFIIKVIEDFTENFTLSYDTEVNNDFKGFTTDSIKTINNVMQSINCEWVKFFQNKMRIYCEFKSKEVPKLMIMMLPLAE